MWFKNLSLYSLPAFSGALLNDALRAGKFEDGPDYMEVAFGWIAPQPLCPDLYAYEVAGQFLIALKTTKRTVPGAILLAETEARVAAFETQYGHKPGKKMRRELKEDAYTALLPKAFPVPRVIRAWIDTKRGTLAVDTSSQKAADTLTSALIRSFEHAMNMRPIKYAKPAGIVMTDWVANGAPEGFQVDDKAVFTSRSGSSVTFDGQAVENAEAVRQIDANRLVTSLALTFDDGLSFVLKGSGAIRSIKPLGMLKERPAQGDEDAAEKFDADFTLMTGTIGELMHDLSDALGGIAQPEDNGELDLSEPETKSSEVAPAAPADDGERGETDPLYDEATRIVYKERRASVSLVQRQLRIGYNRAARLLEAMEDSGLVSAMDRAGNRTITGDAS